MNKVLDNIKKYFLNRLISLGMGYEFDSDLYDDGNWIKLSFWHLDTNYSELGYVIILRVENNYDDIHIDIFKKGIEYLNEINHEQ